MFLVFLFLGLHQAFCSALLIFPLYFASFFHFLFFCKKPDVFDSENHGTVDDLCNTQKESHQQKHCMCLFTDTCMWFFFSGKMPDSNTPSASIATIWSHQHHTTWS